MIASWKMCRKQFFAFSNFAIIPIPVTDLNEKWNELVSKFSKCSIQKRYKQFFTFEWHTNLKDGVLWCIFFRKEVFSVQYHLFETANVVNEKWLDKNRSTWWFWFRFRWNSFDPDLRIFVFLCFFFYHCGVRINDFLTNWLPQVVGRGSSASVLWMCITTISVNDSQVQHNLFIFRFFFFLILWSIKMGLRHAMLAKIICCSLALIFVSEVNAWGSNLGQAPILERFSWRALDFAYPDELSRELAISRREFIPENGLPVGIEIWRNKLFVTVPRWKDGKWQYKQ